MLTDIIYIEIFVVINSKQTKLQVKTKRILHYSAFDTLH